MLNMEEHFKKFYNFAGLLKLGQYDPAQHPMPPDYIEYCVLVQHNPEVCVPFPPGVNLNTVTMNGHKICTFAAPMPSEEAVLVQNEPVYDSHRSHAGHTCHEPNVRSPHHRELLRSHNVDDGQHMM